MYPVPQIPCDPAPCAKNDPRADAESPWLHQSVRQVFSPRSRPSPPLQSPRAQVRRVLPHTKPLATRSLCWLSPLLRLRARSLSHPTSPPPRASPAVLADSLRAPATPPSADEFRLDAPALRKSAPSGIATR